MHPCISSHCLLSFRKGEEKPLSCRILLPLSLASSSCLGFAGWPKPPANRLQKGRPLRQSAFVCGPPGESHLASAHHPKRAKATGFLFPTPHLQKLACPFNTRVRLVEKDILLHSTKGCSTAGHETTSTLLAAPATIFVELLKSPCFPWRSPASTT